MVPLATDALGEVGPVEALEQEFVFYWRSNAAMEPNVAIADVRDGEAEVWTPSQYRSSPRASSPRSSA